MDEIKTRDAPDIWPDNPALFDTENSRISGQIE
jgi:hypothetical protein